ncbi:MAG TPA: site-2 protease family protein, partial [Candidatus Thermoplasmatota archaeon]|nr:site-2 protease family protein [Candidatus Thermoplasmatota archaeon]
MEPLVLDLPAVRARLERRFRVYDVQTEENVLAFFIDPPVDRLEAEFDELKRELKEVGLVPLLKYQGGEHAIYVLRNPLRTRRGWKLNVALFVATVATTTVAGAFSAFEYYRRDFDKSQHFLEEYVGAVLSLDSLWLGFLTFALPLLLILTIHEFGHYVAARRHGVEASLPYFIPVPPFGIGLGIGTFGAFISMREPMPNRKALFDIGAAGPIAGFVVAIPVILVGFALMAAQPVHVGDDDGTISIGTPLLWDALAVPFQLDDASLTHPTAFAGWVGLFVTAINLLPAGQLDGGHIASAMFGERARYASYAAVVGLLGLGLSPLLGLPGYDGWLFFALLI